MMCAGDNICPIEFYSSLVEGVLISFYAFVADGKVFGDGEKGDLLTAATYKMIGGFISAVAIVRHHFSCVQLFAYSVEEYYGNTFLLQFQDGGRVGGLGAGGDEDAVGPSSQHLVEDGLFFERAFVCETYQDVVTFIL